MQQYRRKSDGFTIIEVMIVLVIAAVILLIVFLAVPAVQRNSRNTQRKRDATRLLASAQEWRVNNGNAMPSVCVPNFYCPSPGWSNLTSILDGVGTFSIYDRTKIWTLQMSGTVNLSTVSGGNWDGQRNRDAPIIYIRADCSQGSTISVGREVVIVYTIETGDGDMSLACV